MSDWSKSFQKRKHRTRKLTEVDSEVLVLGQDVGEESLVSQVGLLESESDSLVNSIDRELHDDGVTVEVKIASDNITNTKLSSIVLEFTII